MTYTILNRNGDVIARGYSLAEAAIEVLQYDGHKYEIRRSMYGSRPVYDLWATKFSRNSPAYSGLSETVIFTFEPEEHAATEAIYRQVVRHANWWSGQEVVTDEDYDERQDDLSRQLAEEEA